MALIDADTGMKRCNGCGNSYPGTTEYFYEEPTTSDRLGIYCKTCAIEIAKTYQNANKDTPEYKLKQAAYYQKTRAKRIAYQAEYRKNNRVSK